MSVRQYCGKEMSDPYDQLKRAFERKTGTHLTAWQVAKLMADTAIYDAVMETYKPDAALPEVEDGK